MLTAYILIWPAISAVVLAVIVVSFTRELREAKEEGRKVV
ncbi:putative transporter small subunit [Roseovarius dicentrarchi]|nr:putative transporter small subunit [Roseovarius dicentrarchi]